MTDYTLEDTVYKRFTTRAFATNIPTMLAGTPVVSAYEDDSTTQITAGITLNVDHDGVIGLNLLTIVATAANGFESGKSYDLVVTTGTVDGVSHVGEVVWHFTLSAEAGATDKILNAALSGYQTQGTVGAAITMAAYSGPHGPGVYIDDGAANTGTTLGKDGTVENPVSTVAAGTTIASNLGVQVLYLINDTVLTLTQTYEGFTFVGLGLNNKITLGSQDVDNSMFHNVILTGTQGGTGIIYAIGCALTGLASAEIIAWLCWLTGNNTLRAATTHIFKDCCSAVAGDVTPDLTFPGTGTTEVSVRNYSGGLNLKSGTANDTISFEVVAGQIIIDSSCNSLTVRPRGALKVTDNGVNTNIELEAAINLTNINAEMDNALNTAIPGTPVANSINERVAALNDYAPTAQMVESYAANGVPPTRDQCMLAIHQMLMQFGVAGTSIIVRKLDNEATAFIVTLNDAVNPTDAKRI
jgi:hypothetical protein